MLFRTCSGKSLGSRIFIMVQPCVGCWTARMRRIDELASRPGYQESARRPPVDFTANSDQRGACFSCQARSGGKIYVRGMNAEVSVTQPTANRMNPDKPQPLSSTPQTVHSTVHPVQRQGRPARINRTTPLLSFGIAEISLTFVSDCGQQY